LSSVSDDRLSDDRLGRRVSSEFCLGDPCLGADDRRDLDRNPAWKRLGFAAEMLVVSGSLSDGLESASERVESLPVSRYDGTAGGGGRGAALDGDGENDDDMTGSDDPDDDSTGSDDPNGERSCLDGDPASAGDASRV
jgi:hypothetical protein